MAKALRFEMIIHDACCTTSHWNMQTMQNPCIQFIRERGQKCWNGDERTPWSQFCVPISYWVRASWIWILGLSHFFRYTIIDSSDFSTSLRHKKHKKSFRRNSQRQLYDTSWGMNALAYIIILCTNIAMVHKPIHCAWEY